MEAAWSEKPLARPCWNKYKAIHNSLLFQDCTFGKLMFLSFFQIRNYL